MHDSVHRTFLFLSESLNYWILLLLLLLLCFMPSLLAMHDNYRYEHHSLSRLPCSINSQLRIHLKLNKMLSSKYLVTYINGSDMYTPSFYLHIITLFASFDSSFDYTWLCNYKISILFKVFTCYLLDTSHIR